MTEEDDIVMQRIVRMIMQRIPRRNGGLEGHGRKQIVQIPARSVLVVTGRIVVFIGMCRSRRNGPRRFGAPIGKGNVAIGRRFLNVTAAALIGRRLFDGGNNHKVFHQATIGRRRNGHRVHTIFKQS